MAAPPITATAYPWPGDVLAFANRARVSPYLDPLKDVLERLFPTARTVPVLLEEDPEIRDDWHIVFDVRVPRADVSSYTEAKRRWHEELFRVCPAPLVCTFRLNLVLVAT